jgi:hypothetical protein
MIVFYCRAVVEKGILDEVLQTLKYCLPPKKSQAKKDQRINYPLSKDGEEIS